MKIWDAVSREIMDIAVNTLLNMDTAHTVIPLSGLCLITWEAKSRLTNQEAAHLVRDFASDLVCGRLSEKTYLLSQYWEALIGAADCLEGYPVDAAYDTYCEGCLWRRLNYQIEAARKMYGDDPGDL